MERFSRALLIAFICAGGLVAVASDIAHRRAARSHLREIAGPISLKAFDPTLVAPSQAKRRGLFWIVYPSDFGAALRLRETPALFGEVFPGYEAIRNDDDFWRRYLSLDFDARIYAPSLSESASGAVMTSLGGSLEMFRRYGADIVYLGSSETYESLVPALLSRRLGGRVLSCATSGVMQEQAGQIARVLASSGHRAKVAIWGFSSWSLYHAEGYADYARRFDASLAQQADSTNTASLRRRLWLAAPKWSDFMAYSYQDEWDLRFGRFRLESTFADAEVSDDAELARRAAAIRPYYPGFQRSTEADCVLTGASEKIDKTIADLASTADRVLIFIPPATPLQSGAAPACYLPALRRLLRSKAGPRVTVEVGDWTAYGLGWRDFLRPSNIRGFSWLDEIHVNYGGAVKVTNRVADLIAAPKRVADR